MKKFAIVLAMSGLILSGCDAGPAEGSGDTIVGQGPAADAPDTPETPQSDPGDTATGAAPEAESEPSQDAPEQALGTRGNPAPITATASIGDWDVTIVDVDRDASARILQENQFNDPPDEGRAFVMWTVEAVYTGDDSGDPSWDLSWKLVGSAGNSFDDRCGVIPDNLRDVGETFAGGVATGNVCVSAEVAQLDGGTILVEELFGGSRTFFAVP